MPGPTIGNPAGAFQESLENPNSQAPVSDIRDVYNSGATKIPKNTWVGVDITGTTVHIFGVTQGLHGADQNTIIGIAIEDIPAASVGRVCFDGPANFIAGTGGVTAGNLLVADTNAGHDGQLIAETDGATEPGEVIGIALTTTAVGVVGQMWVAKS